MRRLKLVLGVAALMVAIMAASAAPAAAQTFVSTSGDGFCDGFDEDDEDCFDFLFFDEFCDDFDGDSFCDFDNGFVDFGDGAISQDVEQEAESGDIDQDFDVTGSGDNSNQTASTQGVANTGNAQNVIDIVQVGGDADDFEFEDGGAEIDVSPSSTTNSVNRVDQAASASDD